MKNTKLLIYFFGLVAIMTSFNVVILYWFPDIMPGSLFSVSRVMLFSYITKAYWLIGVSLLICVLLFFTVFSIRRKRILFPVLSLIYLVYDLIVVLFLLIDRVNDGYGYWKTYIIHAVVPIVLIVLLGRYCWVYLFNNTDDSSISFKK